MTEKVAALAADSIASFMPRTDHFELVAQSPKSCGLSDKAMIAGFSRNIASNLPFRPLPALCDYRDLANKSIHDELRHSFHNQLSEAYATDARYHTPARSMVQRRLAMSQPTAVSRASARTCEVASIEIVVDIVLHYGSAMRYRRLKFRVGRRDRFGEIRRPIRDPNQFVESRE